jgi:glyoxylase-like metal-dependent hydrolase (beta-lactamase superfamily II)
MTFEMLFTPGHSPASLSFFCREDKFVIAGDVLFRQSIGRTDLPGGNFDTLMKSIREELLPLGDEVRVFSGHGDSTTIGYERLNNPFLTGRYTL